jgi:integrase
MAQSARDSRLETRTARLRLQIGRRYFKAIGNGLTLVYRRTGEGYGTWSAKVLLPSGKYVLRALGGADDYDDANGADLLSFYDAQDKARGLSKAAKINAGVIARPLTVQQACERYIDHLQAHNGERAAKDARSKLKKHVLPKLGENDVGKLTLTQLRQWFAGLVKHDKEDADAERRSKDTANRVLATFKAALNHAFADETNQLPSDKAWRALKAYKGVGTAREDHFTEAQVLTLIEKAREQDPAFADLIEATFHTGARPPGELAALDVRHFDAKRGQIVIPEGKTGSRVTTLTTEGVEFFRRLAEGKKPRDILLPRAEGDRWGKSEQHRPMKAALKAAELPLSASMYTIRHTYISRAIERGMPLTLIAENVGTSVRMIEQNYAHILAKTRRDLIEKTAPVLRVIEGGKVTQIKDKKSAKAKRR